jgi:hypothetical protein
MMMSFEKWQASIEGQDADKGGLKPPDMRPGTKNISGWSKLLAFFQG